MEDCVDIIASKSAPRPQSCQSCGATKLTSLFTCLDIWHKGEELWEKHRPKSVEIKQPGSVRHPNGQAIWKIECSIEQAIELWKELGTKLDKETKL